MHVQNLKLSKSLSYHYENDVIITADLFSDDGKP